LLKPIVEKKIKEATKLESSLERFSVGLNSLHIVLNLTKSNSITVDGSYSLFS